jgi:hypothetical protein
VSSIPVLYVSSSTELTKADPGGFPKCVLCDLYSYMLLTTRGIWIDNCVY